MAESPLYQPIDPTTFDLIIIGTGLSESIIAAAASASGKSVLHIDQYSFYGSHFSSLSIPDLTSFLNSNSTTAPLPSPQQPPHSDFTVLNLTTKPLYSNVEITTFSENVHDQEYRTKFNLDVSGPRVLYCGDKSIELMIKSGASQYVEFKSVDGSFVGDGNGKLYSVPDSRAAIFQDKSLSLMEKNRLMRFFKLVESHIAASGYDENEQGDDEEEGGARISEEDMESPFVEFLNKMNLSSKIKSIILYAIAMADYDQENAGGMDKDLLRTKDGVDRLALYQSSIGRFTNASGAFIYPIYGQGELSPAFCRRAAVKGCIYVLRMPVIALLMDKNNDSYKGIRLASGQDICSQKLVLDPSFTVLSPSASPLNPPPESFHKLSLGDVKHKVARGICILRSSLKPDMSNFMVFYPPRSLYPEQSTSIRALHVGGSLAVCPSNMFVLYLSSLCDDVHQGKKLINTAINALLSCANSVKLESQSTDQTRDAEVQPILLWSALYIQELTTDRVFFQWKSVLGIRCLITLGMLPSPVFLGASTGPEFTQLLRYSICSSPI
ncbi:rab escort protein 1 isoform X2 [Mercurialis annua]|uniref:rab escort protein 1 isoform X2 n=1 Tax=Mercurialis annua TaxID=3986 RepID=UPI0021603575|nr:rab escort protein 1 isoform X2 [Mercurialis annua]